MTDMSGEAVIAGDGAVRPSGQPDAVEQPDVAQETPTVEPRDSAEQANGPQPFGIEEPAPPPPAENPPTPTSPAPERRSDPVLRAVVLRAREQAELGDLTGARAAREQALESGELRVGPDHPDLSLAMVELASIAQQLGNLTEAQRQLGRAYRITRSTQGAEDVTTLAIEDRLAQVSFTIGEPTGPLDWHLVDVGGRVLGADHAAVRGARARIDGGSAVGG